MRKVGELGKIPVYESPNVQSLDGWFVVQTIGKPGDKDEQFYVAGTGPNGFVEQRYSVPEVLALADWYRMRERERAAIAAEQTTEITTPKGGKR